MRVFIENADCEPFMEIKLILGKTFLNNSKDGYILWKYQSAAQFAIHIV